MYLLYNMQIHYFKKVLKSDVIMSYVILGLQGFGVGH